MASVEGALGKFSGHVAHVLVPQVGLQSVEYGKDGEAADVKLWCAVEQLKEGRTTKGGGVEADVSFVPGSAQVVSTQGEDH